MKKLIIIPTTLVLNACSHAPEPAQATGGWYELNTTIELVKADTYTGEPLLQQTVTTPDRPVQYRNDFSVKSMTETVKTRPEQPATTPKNQSRNNSFLKPTTNTGEIKIAARGATNPQPATTPKITQTSTRIHLTQTVKNTDPQIKARPGQPSATKAYSDLVQNSTTRRNNIRFIFRDGKGSLQKALKEIVPSDWTAEISPEVTKTFRRTVSWQGNDQWPYVLDKMLRNYSLTVIKNTEKRHLLIDFQQQKGKATQKAPVSRDKKPVSPGKLPQKTLTPVSIPPKPAEKFTWNLKKGTTLRDGLMEWASGSPCGNSTWNLVWATPVNYRIDAPLIFRGNFESALKDTLILYLSADKPLYAFRNTTQCVIIIKDTQQE